MARQLAVEGMAEEQSRNYWSVPIRIAAGGPQVDKRDCLARRGTDGPL